MTSFLPFLAICLCILLLAFPAQSASLPSLTNTTVVRQRFPCPSRCRFIVCRRLQTIFLGAPGLATGPTICRRGQNIGVILATGEALISLKGGKRVAISKWRPEGLLKPFPKNYLSTKIIPGRGRLSGVTRLPARRNQNSFLDGTCMRLPITRYEREIGGKIVATDTKDPTKDCLSVQMTAPEIVIEAFWLSGDDMDLSVIEPDGTKLNNRNQKSTCGELIKDNSVDACGIFDSGMETVLYRRPCENFQKGKYRAVLKHGSNCGLGPTKFEVTVVVDGRTRKKVKGVSDATGGKVAASFSFNL